VKWRVLFQLPIEENVARAGRMNVPRNKVGVKHLQSFRIGKLGERSVLQIAVLKGSFKDAE
jgi:hypothetical protein